MKHKYKIAVSWTETGIVEIEGCSVEDAIANAERTIACGTACGTFLDSLRDVP